jgi:hypothetical protein
MQCVAGWSGAGLCRIGLEGVQKGLDINVAIQRCCRRLCVVRLTGLGREICVVGGRLGGSGSGHIRCRGLGDGSVRHALRASVLRCGHIWERVTCTCLIRSLIVRHGRSSLGRDFLACACAFFLGRIRVLPCARAQFCIVHGWVGHVDLGLVETNIHHIVKHWDVGWRWKMERLGRCGREQGYLATQMRFVGVVSRGHVWEAGRGGAARKDMGARGVLCGCGHALTGERRMGGCGLSATRSTRSLYMR